MSGYPLPAPPMVFPPPVPRAPRDVRGVAALVTGLLGLGPVAIALGISAVRHRRREHGIGSGMGLTGIILGSLQTLLYVLIVVVALGVTAAGNTDRAELRASCAEGAMAACDDLYWGSPVHSDDEAFGATCAGRRAAGSPGSCVDAADGSAIPLTYGDDPVLDELWDSCEAGELDSCDDLYSQSPGDSEYLAFGGSCGNRGNDSRWCVNQPGDDPELDGLYDACTAGDWESCDTLYRMSRPGSVYEDYGDTCGNRTDGGQWCTDVPGLDPNV